MGYGRRALTLLKMYYEGQMTSLDECPAAEESISPPDDSSVGLLEERIEPRKNLPPLLLKLSERPPETLDYLGVSYGVTQQLFKFWKKAGFVPVYLRFLFQLSIILMKMVHELYARFSSFQTNSQRSNGRTFLHYVENASLDRRESER